MPAPVSIARTHVHSMRLASGAEALVARVVTDRGVAGFGFSLGTEAFPARDMAAWDALGRSRGLPLYALFGKKLRDRVAIVRAGPAVLHEVNPFEPGTLEGVRSAASHEGLVLLAPSAHPWELCYCAALAATLAGEVCIAVRPESKEVSIRVSELAGIEINWSLEPAFAGLRW